MIGEEATCIYCKEGEPCNKLYDILVKILNAGPITVKEMKGVLRGCESFIPSTDNYSLGWDEKDISRIRIEQKTFNRSDAHWVILLPAPHIVKKEAKTLKVWYKHRPIDPVIFSNVTAYDLGEKFLTITRGNLKHYILVDSIVEFEEV